VILQTVKKFSSEKILISRASRLLSQQVWCWGRDIERSEGNWLMEIGFDRIEPEFKCDHCDSIYTLELPNGKRVMLRAFGVFYGNDQKEGIYLPRYDFLPKYSRRLNIKNPPWEKKDLPKLNFPNNLEVSNCTFLVSELVNWIRTYEENVVNILGLDYRKSTLLEWIKIRGLVIPAEDMVSEWKFLETQISEESPLIFVSKQ
tara:strand:+ start:150 stop:755 length:606 start_codon:yes stop_codon:yes gene_type:complete